MSLGSDITFQVIRTWGPLGDSVKVEKVYGDIEFDGPFQQVVQACGTRKEAIAVKAQWIAGWET